MKKYIKLFAFTLLTSAMVITACKKTEYTFGEIKTPTNLELTTNIIGTTAALPNGDGSGKVTFTAKANTSLSYNINYGDGTVVELIPNGTATHKYAKLGTYDYIVTVTAVGTGGSVTTLSKKITVFAFHNIPNLIMNALTNNGTSQTWETDHDAPGHFGVSPTTEFSPIWYAAAPNTRDACAYDDEITFTKTGDNKISMKVDNKGQTFIIAAATAFYAQAATGDNCYNLTTTPKALVFADATTASTSANSTREQFTVPGNGVVNFGTGGTVYEILSITPTTMHLRNIGADGNAWYQKLKIK